MTKPKPKPPMDGDKLKAALEKLYGNDQSQGVFARTLAVHDRTVRSWINGRLTVPRHIAMLVNLMLDTQSSPEDLRP